MRQTKLASSVVNVSAQYKNTHYQTGHPPSITDIRIAHASQNRACPHGISAKRARCATRYSSQQSSAAVAAAAVADSDAPEVFAAGTDACLSSIFVLADVAAAAVVVPRDSVGTPYERRQNGCLHADTAGGYKRRCRIVTNKI